MNLGYKPRIEDEKAHLNIVLDQLQRYQNERIRIGSLTGRRSKCSTLPLRSRHFSDSLKAKYFKYPLMAKPVSTSCSSDHSEER